MYFSDTPMGPIFYWYFYYAAMVDLIPMAYPIPMVDPIPIMDPIPMV